MSDFYDALETRDPQAREEALLAALPTQIGYAKVNAPAYSASLSAIEPAEITSREALASLPVTRKSDLSKAQSETPPFGGYAASQLGDLLRVFGSPGPIFEPEGKGKDYWRTARPLFAAGFRGGDLVHNTFSYHFTPAGAILESGAHALGCAVFPAGIGQTELQVQTIAHLRPNGYVGTPSFLRMLLDKAKEMNLDVSSMSKALVGGEALPPSLRSHINDCGVAVLQCYATADVGSIAYESPAKEGLIVDEGMLLEICRPGTGDPVAPGEVGEIVVTTFNPDYPLVRFGTGDLSAILDGPSPCGRTNLRIKGWMGRADQTTKVKGMFVHPSQVAAVVKRHAEIEKGRLVVDSNDNVDVMMLQCEVADQSAAGLAEAIATSVRDVCKLRAEVELVASGTLPNDGKVIDDVRSYE